MAQPSYLAANSCKRSLGFLFLHTDNTNTANSSILLVLTSRPVGDRHVLRLKRQACIYSRCLGIASPTSAMEQQHLLNPKKRMLREWSTRGAPTMDQVKISSLFVQQLYLTSLSIPQMWCKFSLPPFFLGHARSSIFYPRMFADCTVLPFSFLKHLRCLSFFCIHI